ncbi:hypothetical protein niasHT_028928 [Heterodera trifolii]|uniref:Chitin-binding type-2 domain-containing protein n=1 Tax=Heterodera trifolii TaxID=157864 RepID=A0ABD2KNI6_9BILA
MGLASTFSLLFFIKIALFSWNVLGQKNDRQLRKPVNCELLKDGNYVWDCSSYYSICANGRELPMECYSGLKLNPNTNQCDTPSSVDPCHRKNRHSNVLYRAADPFNCQEKPDGDYEASACSTIYYTCVRGRKHDKHCPPGLVYNRHARVCDFASKCHKKPYSEGGNKNGGGQKGNGKTANVIGMRAEDEEDEGEADQQQKEENVERNSDDQEGEDEAEKGGKANGKRKKKVARKRRAISSFVPSSQSLHLSPPRQSAAVTVEEQAIIIPSNNIQLSAKAAHYTIFNLYFPKNPKFNVFRSDKELDASAAAEEIATISDLMEMSKAKANRPAEKSEKASAGDGKDLVVEEIADLLIDAIKDL